MRLILVAIVCITCLTEQALARRVALVIGNGDYHHSSVLPNPANDAAAMRGMLEAAGFEVVSGIDLDRQGMLRTLSDFADKLQGAEVGLLYYAGHGMQVNGVNYIVPVDAETEREADVFLTLVSLDQVLQIMESEVPTRLIFLDACRDNPLTRSLRSGARSGAVGKGLARMDTAIGTLIAYATAPGDIAEDGVGSNSPFTTALMEHMPTEGLEIRQVLSRVRSDVHAATNGRQVPWDSSSLMGDFYLSTNEGALLAETERTRTESGSSAELLFWDTIKQSDDPADFEAYISRYGKEGVFHDLALARMAEGARESGRDAQAALERLATVSDQSIVAAVPSASAAHGLAGQTPEKLRSLRDCPECPELIQVPPGRFKMGADRGDPGFEMDEGPVREVTIGQAFAIGRFEVLRGQYRAFVDATGYVSQRGCAFWGTVTSVDQRVDWRRNAAGSGDDEPVTCISAEDAAAYVRWLSEKTGETYRLPTEAEFYYAAAGGRESPYAWGDRPEDACAFGNVYDHAALADGADLPFKSIDCDDGYAALAPAGSFQPNGFGLFDMTGNAAEYVSDCYQRNLPDPTSADTSSFVDSGCARVAIKGGGYRSASGSLQLAERGQAVRRNGGTTWQGLRVLRELD